MCNVCQNTLTGYTLGMGYTLGTGYTLGPGYSLGTHCVYDEKKKHSLRK
jgi:hypothetical protein